MFRVTEQIKSMNSHGITFRRSGSAVKSHLISSCNPTAVI